MGPWLCPLSEQSYRGRVDAAIPDLAAAASLLRLPPVPPLHDVRVGLVLGEGLTPHDVNLHIGASDLAAFLPGATLTQLDLTVPAVGQPGRVVGGGHFAGWSVAAHQRRGADPPESGPARAEPDHARPVTRPATWR